MNAIRAAPTRRLVGVALIVIGVLAWVPYGIAEYGLGADWPVEPILAWHLAGVIPGSYLFGGSPLLTGFRYVWSRRRRNQGDETPTAN